MFLIFFDVVIKFDMTGLWGLVLIGMILNGGLSKGRPSHFIEHPLPSLPIPSKIFPQKKQKSNNPKAKPIMRYFYMLVKYLMR